MNNLKLLPRSNRTFPYHMDILTFFTHLMKITYFKIILNSIIHIIKHIST